MAWVVVLVVLVVLVVVAVLVVLVVLGSLIKKAWVAGVWFLKRGGVT